MIEIGRKNEFESSIVIEGTCDTRIMTIMINNDISFRNIVAQG